MFYESIIEGFDWKKASTNDEHRFVVKSLFGASKEKVLYRRSKNTMLVRTETKPSLHEYDVIEREFNVGSQLLVNVLVNPTDDQNNPISNHPDIERWIKLHGCRYGFDVVTFGYSVLSPFKIIKPNAKPYTLHRVNLDIVIKVTDSVLFAKAYATGIGGSKCYGFGLMLVS